METKEIIENQEGTAAESPKPNRRETLVGLMREDYPDSDFADDDDFYDKLISERGKYKSTEEQAGKLREAFVKDPRIAGLLNFAKEGGNPIIYLIEQYGDEFRDALEDPDKAEEFGEAHKKYQEKVAKTKELEEVSATNLQTTAGVLDALQSEFKLTDDEVLDIFQTASQYALDATTNLYTKEYLTAILRAKNYDKDVESAAMEGEVRGRNERIEETLRKQKPANVPPTLTGNSGGKATEAPKRETYNPFKARG